MILQSTIPPVSEAFRSGTLEMPVEVVPSVSDIAGTAQWGDVPLNGWLLALSALALLIGIRSLYYILPDLVKCLSMWRWNITAENSARFSRERDIYASLCLVPAAILISRYDIFSAGFITAVPESWRTAAVLALLLGYLLTRVLMHGALSQKARNVSGWQILSCAGRNFAITGVLAALTVCGVMHVAGAPDSAIRYGIMAASGLFYLILIAQKSQILGSSCNPFSTFLYLCALEFLPTGLLIAANLCL